VIGFFVASSLVTLGGCLFWVIVHGWPPVSIYDELFATVCPAA
jgi:hypothetical protein